jgi:hypothetical protein
LCEILLTSFSDLGRLPATLEYTPIFVALVVLWELSFPLAIFFRRARLVILAMGIFFHLGTIFFMNLFFPYHLAMYLVFVDDTIRPKQLHARVFVSATKLEEFITKLLDGCSF